MGCDNNGVIEGQSSASGNNLTPKMLKMGRSYRINEYDVFFY
jgi:hypothetical protein